MAALTQNNEARGQNHDRLSTTHDDSLALPDMLPAGDDGGSSRAPVEITAVQKMLSATSGSLLTGLLGMSSHHGLRARSHIHNIFFANESTH